MTRQNSSSGASVTGPSTWVEPPGIVVQHVEPAESIHRPVYRGPHAPGIGDVGGYPYRLAPGGPDSLLRFRTGVRVDLGHDHARPLAREQLRRRAADTGSRAGDEGDLAFESNCHFVSSIEFREAVSFARLPPYAGQDSRRRLAPPVRVRPPDSLAIPLDQPHLSPVFVARAWQSERARSDGPEAAAQDWRDMRAKRGCASRTTPENRHPTPSPPCAVRCRAASPGRCRHAVRPGACASLGANGQRRRRSRPLPGRAPWTSRRRRGTASAGRRTGKITCRFLIQKG